MYKAFLFDHSTIINENNSLANGVYDFLETALEKGVKIAIGTADDIDSIDLVLKKLNIRHYFDVIVSSGDAVQNKPDAETWLQCIIELGVDQADCLLFDNSRTGAQAALDAGLNCIILTISHKTKEFSGYKNVIGYIDDFSAVKYYLLEQGDV